MNWLAALGLGAVFFSWVAITAWVLAPRAERRAALALVLIGLIASFLKIAVFQQVPQWLDINPDSFTYELNARAFALHWDGILVNVESYNLRGLMGLQAVGAHGVEWLPHASLLYVVVIGSSEWLYTAYVGLWYWLIGVTQTTVIWSHALWAAFFPAAAFGIALSIGASKRVALAAAGLGLLDPSAGVNASWLLKDTLAGYLAMAAVWGALSFLRDGGKSRLLVVILTLGALGSVRYVAFIGLALAVGVVGSGLLFIYKQRLRGVLLLAVVLFAWILQGMLFHFSNPVRGRGGAPGAVAATVIAVPGKIAAQGIEVLRSKEGDVGADDAVLNWKRHLVSDPLPTLLRSVARTLFAPYPWVAIHPGLNWVSFSELYYPGVVVWMICLPGIFVALSQGLRRLDPGFWLLTLFLTALLVAYTIWMGEWSTRQRVFALPAFFALAAVGWSWFGMWFNRFRHEVKAGLQRQV